VRLCRPSGALLRRVHPGAIRRNRDPRAVPDPAGARRRDGRQEPIGVRFVTTRPPGAPSSPPGSEEEVIVPTSHRDLLDRPICGVLTPLLPSGQPHSSLMWLDRDGACARVNTTLERWHARNLARDARASLLVVDPDDTSRFVALRGTVELPSEGALEHLDAL